MFDADDSSTESSTSDSSDDTSNSNSSSSESSETGPGASVSHVPDVIDGMVKDLAKVLSGLPENIRLCNIKTLCNAWSTSRRYHERKRLPCLFCFKSKKDNLKHYLRCTAMWSLVNSVMSATISADGDILQKLGLVGSSIQKAYALALAYRVYHCIKMEHLQKVLAARVAGDQHGHLVLIRRIADTYWKEMAGRSSARKT